MKILLVSATQLEIAPLLARWGHPVPAGSPLGVAGTRIRTDLCDVLITGVGQLQCAVHLSNVLAVEAYDCVVHAGIAGSFDPALGKRTVVLVEEECLADFGAETGEGLVDAADIGLYDPRQPPFVEGRLRASRAWVPSPLDLPFVRAVTVNRVLGDPRSIEWVRARYQPAVVSMEGAALFYACLVREAPFVAFRAISDAVGTLDRASWDVPGSINALSAAVGPCVEAWSTRS